VKNIWSNKWQNVVVAFNLILCFFQDSFKMWIKPTLYTVLFWRNCNRVATLVRGPCLTTCVVPQTGPHLTCPCMILIMNCTELGFEPKLLYVFSSGVQDLANQQCEFACLFYSFIKIQLMHITCCVNSK